MTALTEREALMLRCAALHMIDSAKLIAPRWRDEHYHQRIEDLITAHDALLACPHGAQLVALSEGDPDG